MNLTGTDRLRTRYRDVTRQILRWLIARQEFERSAGFKRHELLRQFRDQQRQPETVFAANDHASNLDELTGAYAGPSPVKRQVAACSSLSSRRRDPRKRRRQTPHPAAGAAAVSDSGGAVEALLAEADSEGEDSSENECPEGAQFSSIEEEESDSD